MKFIFILIMLSSLVYSQNMIYTIKLLVIVDSHNSQKIYKEYIVDSKYISNSDILKNTCDIVMGLDFKKISNGLYKYKYQKGDITCIAITLRKY